MLKWFAGVLESSEKVAHLYFPRYVLHFIAGQSNHRHKPAQLHASDFQNVIKLGVTTNGANFVNNIICVCVCVCVHARVCVCV